MSKASSQAARSGSSRCVSGKRTRSATLSQAASAITARQAQIGSVEVEPEIDHQHGDGLADDREPAQPHQRVEAHAAPRSVGLPWRVGRPWRECSPSRPALKRGRWPRAAGGGPCVDGARQRHICRACSSRPSPDPQPASPPSPSTSWSRSTRPTRAVDGISFALEQGSITGLLGGNGAGKTTTIAMIMGLVDADLRHASRCSAPRCRAQRYRVLHRMNFESPYVDMPHRLTVRQNLTVFGRLYGGRGSRRPHRRARRASSISTSSSTGRPASSRPGRRPASRSPRR